MNVVPAEDDTVPEVAGFAIGNMRETMNRIGVRGLEYIVTKASIYLGEIEPWMATV